LIPKFRFFVEFIRGSILSGFPWNLIAYSFSNHLQILSIASLIGTYSLNLFCITLFLSPVLFILRNDNKDLIFCLILPLIFLLFYFFGYSNKQDFYNSDIEKLDYKIRLLGTDISLDRFYSGEGPLSTIEDLIYISSPNKKDKTIFIWPEGILPGISQDQIQSYDYLFNESFNENHLLILGINNKSKVNNQFKYYNSLSVYDHNLNLLNYYNKINLVPFGEFLPMEDLLKKIGLRSLTNNYQSYSKGQKREIIDLNQNNFSIKFLPLICYEIIYSGKLYENDEFDVIVNVSEDGWFGESIGPEQHFVHSIFRAIESGKYVIRSANNGIAAIVNPLGIVEEKINFKEIGHIDFTKMRKIKLTIFSKYGNKIFGLIILLYIFLIFSFNRIKNE
jgi:apolipoprotein N-acyltransferase